MADEPELKNGQGGEWVQYPRQLLQPADSMVASCPTSAAGCSE